MSDEAGTRVTEAAAAHRGQHRDPRRRSLLGSGNTVLVTVLAFVVALVIGAVFIAVADPDTQAASKYFFSYPWDTFTAAGRAVGNGYAALFRGAVFNPDTASRGTLAGVFGPISETLVNATPLILGGLSVGLAFRAGLFNIGGQGQVILGAVFAGYVGFAWHLPAGLHVIVAVLAGIVGGALWGGIAGLLKARTGAHEVITTIMLNYVALNLLAYLLSVKGFQRPPYGQAISEVVDADARLPRLLGGSLRLHAGLLVALAAALAIWWLLTRSTLGFQLRAVGANQSAARTAGMVLAGLLFGALHAGGVQMQSSTGTPVDLVQVIQSLVVLFIAAPAVIRAIFRIRVSGGGTGQALAKGWNG